MSNLITPYGGELINLIVDETEQSELMKKAINLPRVQISLRSLCDLELLAAGGFSPLKTFMNQADYESVLERMQMADGTFFPLPVTLSVNRSEAIKPGREIALADQNNNLLAVMRIEEIYEWNREREAQLAYGTNDLRHPLVAQLYSWGEVNISGRLRVISLPHHHDFVDLRLTPRETRKRLAEFNHPNVVAFQTRNPLHRIHEEMTKRAMDKIGGTLLLHPVVGLTKQGDIDHFTRVRAYKALVRSHYDQNRVLLSLLPLAMRMAGPKEALLHAIIRRNYGANHFIVGRDHAGPGLDSTGKPFYGPFDAQELVKQYQDEIGVTPLTFDEMIYLPDEDRYEEVSKVEGKRTLSLSGTQVREDYLFKGKTLPPWFTRPETARILQQTHLPRHQQGFCLWFTGLSGSGKSTTAEILIVKLLEHGRQMTMLDGDVVRTNLSKGLGFSKEDRDINIRRIGFVAAEIARHGGGVICAAVSPYRSTRNECRAMFGSDNFIEIFVDTPLAVCESRDVKGMYQLAREGKIKNFTGIDDPYESPEHPEITIDTTAHTAAANAEKILAFLIEKGFVMSGIFSDETAMTAESSR
jgi:sulfate adenylyltransferase